MKRLCLAFCLGAVACHSAPRGTVSGEPSQLRPDSIVLRRSPCFGTCPVYRLRVTARGAVAFNDGREFVDSVSPAVVDSLVAYANHVGLMSLPDTIQRGSPHCRDYATDHATIHLDLFGAKPKHMLYYTGCYTGAGFHAPAEPMRVLRSFAAQLDTLTLATRWIRPARRR